MTGVEQGQRHIADMNTEQIKLIDDWWNRNKDKSGSWATINLDELYTLSEQVLKIENSSPHINDLLNDMFGELVPDMKNDGTLQSKLAAIRQRLVASMYP